MDSIGAKRPESGAHALAKALLLVAAIGAAIGVGFPLLIDLAAAPFR